MHYIIQENVFKEYNYYKIVEVLSRLGLSYDIVKFDNAGNLITPTLNTPNIFAFGSSKIANLATKSGWFPGSFFGVNLDYELYEKVFKEHLLNFDSMVCQLNHPLEWQTNELKFIRPTRDSKLFNGGLYSKVRWEDTIERFPDDIRSLLDNRIQVNNPKQIFNEARVWIIKGKIVTSSYYKIGNNVVWKPDVEPEGIDFAQQMIYHWQNINLHEFSPAYCMDICNTPIGWKIVEFNCINCSAFYECDLQKVVIELEYNFNNKD